MNNLTIKRLGKEDVTLFQQLLLTFQQVFEMEKTVLPEAVYLETLLTNSGFIVYVILIENKVVGGLTAYELPSYYNKKSEIFIYDIAIQSTFQRQGLGKQLIESVKEYGKQKDISSIFVNANKEDEHALDFYHSTGGKAEKVVQFTYY